MNLSSIKEKMTGEILRFSLPAIIAMILTSLITIADGFFVGNYVGKEGIAAINLGLPILYFYLAVGIMLGVGGSAIAGMALGDRNLKKCQNVFNQTIVTALAVSVGTSLLVLLLFGPISALLIHDETVLQYFKAYYHIMLFVYPFMVLNSCFGMFIRGEGNPQFFMQINMISVLCNIVLDFVMIKVFCMGVKGAAYASMISVLLAFVCLLAYHCKKAKVFSIGAFSFDKEVCKSTILNGSSEFIGELSMCIAMFAYNMVIMKYIGISGVAAFTIVGYVSFIFSMIITGFGQGASPLISFTYGAGEQKLSAAIRKKTNMFVFGVGVLFILLMLLLSGWYSNAFVKDSDVIQMVHSGVLIFIISFLFTGVNTITSFYFTSIGKAKESAVISSMRGFVILLICIFTLPAVFGMLGVWLVAPITEFVTVLVTAMYIRRDNILVKTEQ